ncbi:uncharacterized protein LOC116203574 isoform X1 [Punica granatum]|uniref:Uncharacterized protein LOC116203574 isoform X1 n=1 Tax=Punica granatum TaxID=22663 RepID=A0A6P8DIA8_PUNGR|nr:uncharacterized protein LOC116203574 isoform X1 [Punica granatum]
MRPCPVVSPSSSLLVSRRSSQDLTHSHISSAPCSFLCKSTSGTTYDVDLKCVHDNEDRKPVMETKFSAQVSMLRNLEDAKVDVVECSNSGSAARCLDPQDPDATEYSSSFSGTVSDSEHCSGLSDAEVESQFSRDNNLPPAFDVFNGILHVRKKKLTNHWRNFIRPLMWRCKWTELRIKEIESQALNYAHALSAYEQESQTGLDEYKAVEEFSSKSLPFSHKHGSRRIMKRRKRKRVEEITDVSSYMSHHNLFSFLENRRLNLEANLAANEVNRSDKTGTAADDFGATPDRSSFKSRQLDSNLEQVLQKIEVVYSRVHKLRNQFDLIMSQNALKFSSSENLSLLLGPLEEAQTSSAPSPTFSAKNEDFRLMGHDQHNPSYDPDNLVLPESVVSSFGEVSIPDVIESTVGLLSAAHVTLRQPKLEDTTEDVRLLASVLIHNEAAEGEVTHVLKSWVSELTAKQHESDKGEQDESPDPSPHDVTQQQQSNMQPGLASDIHVPMNKRKRGERKSGSGGWNK